MKYDNNIMKIYIALVAVLLKAPQMCSNSRAKLASGWALNSVKFDPMQEFGPIVGGGHSCKNTIFPC